MYSNNNNKENISDERDYKYEHYLDSIWENNQDYYLDVIIETDDYNKYIEKHGEYWKDKE